MISLLDIHKKIYDFIKSLGYTVVDEVTMNTALPYTRLGYSTVDDIGIKDIKAYSSMQYIDIFSNYKGSKEIKEITYDICDKLLEHNFSTNDYTVNITLYHIEFMNTQLDEIKNKDDISKQDYRHSVLIFKIDVYK